MAEKFQSDGIYCSISGCERIALWLVEGTVNVRSWSPELEVASEYFYRMRIRRTLLCDYHRQEFCDFMEPKATRLRLL